MLSPTAASPLLSLQNLTIAVQHKDRSEIIVHNINTSVNPGEIVAWVGESGAGKTMLALSVFGLTPGNISIQSGRIFFRNIIISENSSRQHSLNGQHIAMIFQQAMEALNPVFTVGRQIRDIIRHHHNLSKKEADSRIYAMFEEVGLDDPATIFRAYPHQLSGGMAQRVMIALAIICRPDLIIADEPTTALDASTQYRIIQLLKSLHHRHHFSMILISHDIHFVSQLADKIVVLKDGRILESNDTTSMVLNPEHHYTKALLTL